LYERKKLLFLTLPEESGEMPKPKGFSLPLGLPGVLISGMIVHAKKTS